MEDILILLGIAFNLNLPLLTAWLLDHWLGDPTWLPHPVVAFGKAISFCEHRLNQGDSRFLKGALMTVLLVAGVSCLGGICHYAFVAPLGGSLFSGYASGCTDTVDILLSGGHYVGSRGTYGIQGCRPFPGGRQKTSGTHRRP